MSYHADVIHTIVQPTAFTLWNISLSFVAVWLCQLFYRLNRSVQRRKEFRLFAKADYCALPVALPRPFLASLRHKVGLLISPGGDLLDNVFAAKFRRYGPTYALLDKNGIPIVIHTIDPVNLNAMLSKSVDDWSPSKSRARTMYPLAQDGLLNSDGEAWHRNRKLMLRHINTKRLKDASTVEPDTQLLFDAIGPVDEDGWTEEVDLLDLFHRMSLDMSTTFLLGTSANSQKEGMRNANKPAAMYEHGLVCGSRSNDYTYEEAYEIVRNYFSWRSKLGSKYWLADGKKYRKACATLNAFTDNLIRRAIQRSKSSNDAATDDNFGLIDSLVKEICAPIQIRNLSMDLFIAGQNMSGTIAAWTFAQLEANPCIYSSLRSEILSKFGTEDRPKLPPTWDNLRSCELMQNVILETLRMYPLLANIGRNAKCDTILPRGGGLNGDQPIAVPKGAAVTCNVYLMHRRALEWGEDAWEWKPERWEDRKIGKEFAPFGGGKRVCVGQQLTMTQLSYLIARMCMRFDGMRRPEGQDNLEKGYRVVVAPKNGVKVKLHKAA